MPTPRRHELLTRSWLSRLTAVIAAAGLLVACSSHPSAEWVPASYQSAHRDVIKAAQRGDALDKAAPAHWVWEDAHIFRRNDGHWLVWVYYESEQRGKVWTSIEIDASLDVIACGGFSEG